MIKTIIGKKGSGKTTLTKHLVNYRSKPVIIVDLFNQFHGQRFFEVPKLLDFIIEGGLTISRPVCISIFDQADFAILCEVVIRHKDLLFVIDEVDFFDSPASQAREFKKMIHYSRHYGIDIITTSRRPANISRDLTSQTDIFSIFRITEKRDLDYFYALNAELPEQIKALQPHHYIEYDHDSITVKPPISI
jgi:cytidylate kinase